MTSLVDPPSQFYRGIDLGPTLPKIGFIFVSLFIYLEWEKTITSNAIDKLISKKDNVFIYE